MIFAREVSDTLASLVKKIDAATVENKSKRMGSFVVFLNDDEKVQDQLKALAKSQDLKQCVLTVDNVAGPDGYGIAKEADVTVLLYNKRKIAFNYAFKKGELSAQAVEKILADLPKIMAGKKTDPK
jgi:hypothetical protein